MTAADSRIAIVGVAGALATEALAWILTKSGNHVVGVYSTVRELDSVLRAGPQELQAAIIDADEQTAGLGAVAEIRCGYPELKILLLCEVATPAVVRCAIEEHAEGVVLKSETVEDMVLALRHVLAGRSVMPVGWQAASVESEPGPIRAAALSVREREVLDLVTAGMSNEEVAKHLVISSNTVKFHLRMIYSRLGVHNRVEATRVGSHVQVNRDGASNLSGSS
ncbi:MAG TPA: response regulator transcription factor [Solirubrobacteraceae bacterium]|nr:response regulator transcription factor [Solirubrobacteraceae bacterium]